MSKYRVYVEPATPPSDRGTGGTVYPFGGFVHLLFPCVQKRIVTEKMKEKAYTLSLKLTSIYATENGWLE